MKIRVRATNAYKELHNLPDKELQRVPLEGEEWEVDEKRFKVLSDPNANTFGRVFVTKVEEPETKKAGNKKNATKK